MEAGAHLNDLDLWKRTPTRPDAARTRIDPDFVRLLVDRGADVDHQDNYQQSPVLESLRVNDQVVEPLTRSGTNIDAKDESGNILLL
jgi:ankyrin repeat protein